MNDDGLQNAVLPNVFGELFKFALGKLGARVVRILKNQRDGHEHWPAVWDADLDRGRWNLCRRRRRSAQVRGRGGELVKLVWLLLEVEKIELSVFGFVPRHAHKCIVPFSIDLR